MTGETRRKTRRTSSNVFSMFHNDQMGELRDAFSLFDTDNDGSVTVEDLTEFLKSIGEPFTQDEIKTMVDEIAPNANFMMFLTHIGDMMSKISDIQSIIRNFKNLDEQNVGKISASELKTVLEIDDESFDKLTKDCIKNGQVDYYRLAVKMRYGEIIESEIKLDTSE